MQVYLSSRKSDEKIRFEYFGQKEKEGWFNKEDQRLPDATINTNSVEEYRCSQIKLVISCHLIDDCLVSKAQYKDLRLDRIPILK